MLISHRHKFIFFHVPKVAGSSITAAFRKFSDIPSERLYNYLFELLGQCPRLSLYERHISPFELSGILGDAFSGYYCFAFVRNPFDWHVSQYHYHKQHSNALFHEQFRNYSFRQYLYWTRENLELTRCNQSSFLSDNNGNLITDFTGRFENLREDVRFISEKLGLNIQFPHINPSTRDHYRKYYGNEEISIVNEINAEDLHRFKYTF